MKQIIEYLLSKKNTGSYRLSDEYYAIRARNGRSYEKYRDKLIKIHPNFCVLEKTYVEDLMNNVNCSLDVYEIPDSYNSIGQLKYDVESRKTNIADFNKIFSKKIKTKAK